MRIRPCTRSAFSALGTSWKPKGAVSSLMGGSIAAGEGRGYIGGQWIRF